MTFDPVTCRIEVERTWIDAGPANRDVRLTRVWNGTRWEWADDWQVRDGQLLRPGRAPIPYDGTVGGERLTLDEAGRVIARASGGRTVEIVRDNGRFAGMRAGPVSVRIETNPGGGRVVAGDGRSATWTDEKGWLGRLTDEAGVATEYTMTRDALAGVAWADGTRLAFDESGDEHRIVGDDGTWTCRASADATTVAGPTGTWTVRRGAAGETVTDPAGRTTQTRRSNGRITGWTDPRGAETQIARGADGRPVAVTDPGGAEWTFTWDGPALTTVGAPDGGRWTLRHGPDGGLAGLTDPAGRDASFNGGWTGVAAVRRGAGTRTTTRDRAGRVIAFGDGAGGDVRLTRDAAGRVTSVSDGGGGVWAIGRDAGGRPVSLTDPAGARWTIGRDALGRITSVGDPVGRESWDAALSWFDVQGRGRWALGRGSAGLARLQDPLGRMTAWARDGMGRITRVERPDGTALDVTRDGAGDVTRIADVRIRRDAAGRALEASIPGSDALVWDRDAAGRVVGVHGPGAALALQRGADGAIRAIRVGERAEATLTRDGAGRVVGADGDVPVTLARDAAGRIVGIERRGSPAMRIERDARGLPARVTIEGKIWTFGRDGAGRVVRAAGPGGLSLGVARDAAGRVTLLRFPDGTMARVEQRPDGAFAQLQDAGQRLIADARWQLDPVGALLHLRTSDRVGETTWSWRRAPDGTLVALESDRAVWSASPAGIEGPGGSGVTWDGRGRAVTAKTLSNAWGIGAGAIRYERAADGTIVAIAGPLGTARLRHDGVGRLVAVDGPSGSTSILRDALGRLVRAGGVAIEGWEAPLVVGGAPRVTVADAGLAAAGRGIVFDPRGTPILAAPGGVVETAPSGLSVSAVPEGAAGRLQAFAGGPLLALLDAIDPVSGAATAPGVRWPWTGPTWEVSPGESTEADPDATARVPWDPDAWAPDSPWSDPLALLVAIGELPSPGAELRAGDCDGSAARRGVPGVPWLPASLAPELPAPIPDVDALAIDEEPIVRFVLCHALAPTRPADPASLTTALLGERMAREVRLAPDLAPQLPAGLAR